MSSGPATKILNNARDFFDEVTKPCYDDFFNSPSTFKNAFAMAMSLFNIHEWIFEFDRHRVQRKYKVNFSTAGEFWKNVESIVPEAKFIRDLSNASKHVRLRLKPSTSMTHIANTQISVTTSGGGAFRTSMYRRSPSVKMEDKNAQIELDVCAQKLFAYWEKLIEELYPTVITLPAGLPKANQ